MTVLAHDRPPLPARARPAVPDPSQPVAAQLGGVVAQPDASNRDGVKHSPDYEDALTCAQLLSDAEIKELHRHVSRLARAAYGRDERYQANYRMGMEFAAPKIEAWNARVEAFAAHAQGVTVAEYRERKRRSGAPGRQ